MIYKDCSAVVDDLRICERVNLFGNRKLMLSFKRTVSLNCEKIGLVEVGSETVHKI